LAREQLPLGFGRDFDLVALKILKFKKPITAGVTLDWPHRNALPEEVVVSSFDLLREQNRMALDFDGFAWPN
jgi:hypothetical protein